VRPAVPLICRFIDEHKERFGVAPVCRALSAHGVQAETPYAHATTTYDAFSEKKARTDFAQRTRGIEPDRRSFRFGDPASRRAR
jgi:hypothetical protein